MMAAKKRKPMPKPRTDARDSAANSSAGATLKDLLAPEMLQKLKAQAEELKAGEHQKRAEAARLAEEERLAEQKRRDNDFGYLLDNSKLDWKTYK